MQQGRHTQRREGVVSSPSLAFGAAARRSSLSPPLHVSVHSRPYADPPCSGQLGSGRCPKEGESRWPLHDQALRRRSKREVLNWEADPLQRGPAKVGSSHLMMRHALPAELRKHGSSLTEFCSALQSTPTCGERPSLSHCVRLERVQDPTGIHSFAAQHTN